MSKLLLDAAASTINCDSLSLWSITKVFLAIQGAGDSCYVLNYK